MAHFDSVVTDYGAQVLAAVIAGGGSLQLSGAAAGKGRYVGSPAQITALVDPLTIPVDMGEKSFDSATGVMRIPIQITNQGLTQPAPIREVAIYGTHNGASFLFGYSWLVGEDSDNVIGPSRSDDSADTIHIHDMGLFLTNQEAASITVQIGGGTYVSQSELHIYAAEKDHTHGVATHEKDGFLRKEDKEKLDTLPENISEDSSGNVYFEGSINNANYSDQNKLGCLELYPPANNSGHGGYIDFHFNQSEADYTSRIMEEVSGELSFAGTKIKVAAPAVGESARYVRNIFCHTSTSVTGMQNGEVLHVYA